MKRLLAMLVLALAGCSGEGIRWVRTGPVYPPRPPTAPVEVYLGEKRPERYEEIGFTRCGGGWTGAIGNAIEFAKRDARGLGGDCIIFLRDSEHVSSTPDPVFGGHSTSSSTLYQFSIGRMVPPLDERLAAGTATAVRSDVGSPATTTAR